MRLGGASAKGFKSFTDKSLEDWRIANQNGLWGGFTVLFKIARKVIQLRPYFFVVFVASLGIKFGSLVSTSKNENN